MIKFNNKNQIKIPDEIIVDTADEVLYRNQEGKLKGNRDSVRYANSRKHDNFPNKPTKGWRVLNYREGYNGKYSRIHITNLSLFGRDDIEVGIRADYMFDLIIAGVTLIEGEIQKPCVIGFDQWNSPMLIPESHEYYKNASYPNPNLPIPTNAKELIVGAAYEINENNKPVYIGELKKGLRIDNNYTRLVIKKQKLYVFFEEKSNQVTFRTDIGKTLFSDTISVDAKSQDQCDNLLELVKKSVINLENGGIVGIEFNLDSIKDAKDEVGFENKTFLYNSKQYKAKDCFLYLEQESSTKINILLKLENTNYIKLSEIIFDTKLSSVGVNYLTTTKSITVVKDYSANISEIETIGNNYVPSKPVQKLFSLISNCLSVRDFGYGLLVTWNEVSLLGSNLNLITASGKIFPKQVIVDCLGGSTRSINIKEL